MLAVGFITVVHFQPEKKLLGNKSLELKKQKINISEFFARFDSKAKGSWNLPKGTGYSRLGYLVT